MNRLQKINSQLQKSISEILNNKINDPRIKGIISVSNVSVTADLKFCKILLSIYNENPFETFNAIKSATGYIRKVLAKDIQLRCVPMLEFNLDSTAEYSQKINKILSLLKNKEDYDPL